MPCKHPGLARDPAEVALGAGQALPWRAPQGWGPSPGCPQPSSSGSVGQRAVTTIPLCKAALGWVLGAHSCVQPLAAKEHCPQQWLLRELSREKLYLLWQLAALGCWAGALPLPGLIAQQIPCRRAGTGKISYAQTLLNDLANSSVPSLFVPEYILFVNGKVSS